MDKETREFLDRKFNAVDEKFAGLDEKFAGIDEKFAGIDEKFEETKRYFGVVAEGLEHKIQLVAEGVSNLNEKLDRHNEENEAAHREILSAIKFSYAELDRRINTVESEVTSLKNRVERLERER